MNSIKILAAIIGVPSLIFVGVPSSSEFILAERLSRFAASDMNCCCCSGERKLETSIGSDP